ncbi:uncharacterized protein LOC143032414 [Oratosquilla oratoria]|uniref:uncharacterized protein LOC143032414 n=1 Tax=Oratosquilla oratoria TaxID=337810 RepID=UPI003F762FF8
MDPPSLTSTLWKKLLDEDLELNDSAITPDSIVTSSSCVVPSSDLITSSNTSLASFESLPYQAPSVDVYGLHNKTKLNPLLMPQSSYFLPRSDIGGTYICDNYNHLDVQNSNTESQWENSNEIIDLGGKWDAEVNYDQYRYGSQTHWQPFQSKIHFSKENVGNWFQGKTLNSTSNPWSVSYSHPPSDVIQELSNTTDSSTILSPPPTPNGAPPASVLKHNEALHFEGSTSSPFAYENPRPEDSGYPYSVIAQKIAGLALEEVNTKLRGSQMLSTSLQSLSCQSNDSDFFHLNGMSSLPPAASTPGTMISTPPWSPAHSCSSDTKVRTQTRLPRKDLVSLMEELAAYKAQRCGDSQDYSKRMNLDFHREDVSQMQKNEVGKGCVFCKNNNYHATFYTSHTLKDERGVCQCPVLRTYVCPLCGASGDTAHTLKYCPRNVITKGDPISAGLPPGKVTNWKQVARQLF